MVGWEALGAAHKAADIRMVERDAEGVRKYDGGSRGLRTAQGMSAVVG